MKRAFEEIEKIKKLQHFNSAQDLLRYSLSFSSKDGMFLEFGVFRGFSIKFISNLIPNKIIHGFDSFYGLPERWKDSFEKGAFNLNGKVPDLGDRICLHKGLFSETLPKFLNENKNKISFIHIDSDIYSSAKEVLFECAKFIVPGTIIQFDEFYNYHGFELHEAKAFFEFVDKFNVEYSYLGKSIFQVSLKINKINKNQINLTLQKKKKKIVNNFENNISRFTSFSKIDNSYKNYYCILSFDRPLYLEKLIKSLEKYEDKESIYILCQDNNLCFKHNESVCEKINIEKCVSLFLKSKLKNKHIFLAEKNYGPAKMRRESYRIIFDNSNIDFCVFMEDDVSIGKNCLKIINNMEKDFRDNPNVFAVSPFNKYQIFKNRNYEETYNIRNMAEANLDHITLILGIWKNKYNILIKDFDNMFYKYYSRYSYRKEILSLYNNEMYKYFKFIENKFNGASDDIGMALCLVKNKMVKLSSSSNHIYYNGIFGTHGNSSDYYGIGFDRVCPDNIMNDKKFILDKIKMDIIEKNLFCYEIPSFNNLKKEDILLIT